VIRSFNYALEAGDKVAIIGENGVGKTTLLRLLMGELAPQHGTVKWADKARPGYFAQDHAADFTSRRNAHRLDQRLCARRRLRRRRRRNADPRHAGPLLFGGDDVKKAVRVLSGGEQGRMLFGRLMLLRKNVLLMDEPTNHLDMESIESLNTGAREVQRHAGLRVARPRIRLVAGHAHHRDRQDGRSSITAVATTNT
jgi:ATPase subunit of ABC transporter with duplicated ATPase domains